jgi:hypothetical protein
MPICTSKINRKTREGGYIPISYFYIKIGYILFFYILRINIESDAYQSGEEICQANVSHATV